MRMRSDRYYVYYVRGSLFWVASDVVSLVVRRTYIAGRPGGVSGHPLAWYLSVS